MLERLFDGLVTAWIVISWACIAVSTCERVRSRDTESAPVVVREMWRSVAEGLDDCVSIVRVGWHDLGWTRSRALGNVGLVVFCGGLLMLVAAVTRVPRAGVRAAPTAFGTMGMCSAGQYPTSNGSGAWMCATP